MDTMKLSSPATKIDENCSDSKVEQVLRQGACRALVTLSWDCQRSQIARRHIDTIHDWPFIYTCVESHSESAIGLKFKVNHEENAMSYTGCQAT